MSDYLDGFFRCHKQWAHWTFEVATVEWDGTPHTPRLSWTTFRRWIAEPNPQEILEARTAALATPRFFRTCTRCGELTNTGHMHDQRVCQGCAEKFLGVIH